MSNKTFTLDIDDFYLMLAIILWFVGCLSSLNYPVITLLLYGIALVSIICAYKVTFKKNK